MGTVVQKHAPDYEVSPMRCQGDISCKAGGDIKTINE